MRTRRGSSPRGACRSLNVCSRPLPPSGRLFDLRRNRRRTQNLDTPRCSEGLRRCRSSFHRRSSKTANREHSRNAASHTTREAPPPYLVAGRYVVGDAFATSALRLQLELLVREGVRRFRLVAGGAPRVSRRTFLFLLLLLLRLALVSRSDGHGDAFVTQQNEWFCRR